MGGLRALTPLRLRFCGQPEEALGPGAHRVVAASTPAWLATALSGGGSVRRRRSAGAWGYSVASWSSTDRRVRVDARTGTTVLRVTENANPGWTATANGHRLTSIVVNGWQQGYVLPAGAATTVHVRYAPDRAYRIALLIGAIAAIGLIGCGLVCARDRAPGRRRRRRVPTVDPARAGWAVPVAGVVACVLVAGWWGLAVSVVVGAGARLARRWSTDRVDRGVGA